MVFSTSKLIWEIIGFTEEYSAFDKLMFKRVKTAGPPKDLAKTDVWHTTYTTKSHTRNVEKQWNVSKKNTSCIGFELPKNCGKSEFLRELDPEYYFGILLENKDPGVREHARKEIAAFRALPSVIKIRMSKFSKPRR